MNQKEFIKAKLELFDKMMNCLRWDKTKYELDEIKDFISQAITDQAKMLEEMVVLKEFGSSSGSTDGWRHGFNFCRQEVIKKFKEYQDK